MSHKDVVLLIREKNVNDNVAINNIIADNSMQQPNIENFDKLTLSNGVMCGISPIDSNSINEIVHIFMEKSLNSTEFSEFLIRRINNAYFTTQSEHSIRIVPLRILCQLCGQTRINKKKSKKG